MVTAGRGDGEKPGWCGVSFRGIDVPQYSPDAVDTPICNDPDAISVAARDRVPKMRQGGSYSASSGLSTRFRTRPEVTENSIVSFAQLKLLLEVTRRILNSRAPLVP